MADSVPSRITIRIGDDLRKLISEYMSQTGTRQTAAVRLLIAEGAAHALSKDPDAVARLQAVREGFSEGLARLKRGVAQSMADDGVNE